jgi:hypothetical protein
MGIRLTPPHFAAWHKRAPLTPMLIGPRRSVVRSVCGDIVRVVIVVRTDLDEQLEVLRSLLAQAVVPRYLRNSVRRWANARGRVANPA